MKHNTDISPRKSIRLKNYDYSQNGGYFITICTKNRECLFGEVIKDRRGTTFCALTDLGSVAKICWQEIPQHYPEVMVDEFIVMPNHIHGILRIQTKNQLYRYRVEDGKTENNNRVQNVEPLRINEFQKIIPQSIGSIIRGYKIGVTKWSREHENVYTVWQRNYYEHIIRDEDDLNRIREYIISNPMNWEKDELFNR